MNHVRGGERSPIREETESHEMRYFRDMSPIRGRDIRDRRSIGGTYSTDRIPIRGGDFRDRRSIRGWDFEDRSPIIGQGIMDRSPSSVDCFRDRSPSITCRGLGTGVSDRPDQAISVPIS